MDDTEGGNTSFIFQQKTDVTSDTLPTAPARRPTARGYRKRWLLPLCGVLIASCALPSLEGRSVSSALAPADAISTPLGQALQPLLAAHAGETGILPLADAQDAFAARVLLARAAQRTLDVQYYIWHGDITGTLLLRALHDAAERGVRVRL